MRKEMITVENNNKFILEKEYSTDNLTVHIYSRNISEFARKKGDIQMRNRIEEIIRESKEEKAVS